MCDREPPSAEPLFEVNAGQETFHGLPVIRVECVIGPETFRIAKLEEAADLLDEPDYARRFLEQDVAPYGVELWPAATMLANWIVRQEPGAGREAVELGCGLGLVTLAAARHGWRMRATDNEETALRFARFNTELNGITGVRFELIDWKHPPPGRRFERIFAADVLYQLVDHEPLLECIERLLAPNGIALIADPKRRVADRFEAMATERGFTVELIPASASGPCDREVNGRIFVLRREA